MTKGACPSGTDRAVTRRVAPTGQGPSRLSPPPEASAEQFYETDPAKPYRRGFSVQTVSPLPITWSEHVTAQGHWGEPLREYMRDYVHWATRGALCELLPRPATGSPWPRRRTGTACRSRTSPTASATTTSS